MTNPRLIIPPGNYSKQRHPDKRGWTFRHLALYQPRQHKRFYWVKVQLPDGSKHSYQLPKDIQFAIRNHHNYKEQQQIAEDTLIDALINVPISRYQKDGSVKLTTAKVTSVYHRKSTRYPNQITRSQFVKPSYGKYGFLKFKQTYRYLRHDFSTANRRRIFFSILKLVPLRQRAS